MDLDSEPHQINPIVKEEEVDLGEDVIIIKNEDENERLLCDQCGFTAFSDTTFTGHSFLHIESEPKPFICDHCHYATLYIGDINTHYCKDQYFMIKPSFQSLKSPLKVPVKKPLEVSVEKPLEVSVKKPLEVPVKKPLKLRKPKPKETLIGNKNIKCSQCAFTTATSDSLVCHYNEQHADMVYYYGGKYLFKTKPQKIFKCSKCDYTNPIMRLVKEHMKKVHLTQKNVPQFSNVRWYKCGICPFKATTESGVIGHMHVFHFSYNAGLHRSY